MQELELSVREAEEQLEHRILSKRAAFADESSRRAPEDPCPIRTAFQRDRDRVLHCSAFRRLKHKTQVFLSPSGDHYRTRLTHTIEVAQISRTLARALHLNEDLTEAIALAHDLGHTPFGHAGERALAQVVPGGFQHFEQSLRVVDVLEKQGRGLCLTDETRDGIVCHTTGTLPRTLEGQCVRLCDRIAYINHDIEDAQRAGVLREEDLPEEVRVLGAGKSRRIFTLVASALRASEESIQLEPSAQTSFDALHRFMFEHVYTNPVCKSEEGKAMELVTRLYEHSVRHPEQLPEEYQRIAQTDSTERAACDYIAGMTDPFAVRRFGELFIPVFWGQ